MGSGPVCACGHRDAWRVTVRCGNYSAFSGYRRTYSDYSEVLCEREEGGCGVTWRTKAKYVATLKDSERHGEARIEPVVKRQGGKEPRAVEMPSTYRAPLRCEACGKQGGPMLGPLTSRDGKLVHRDGCNP